MGRGRVSLEPLGPGRRPLEREEVERELVELGIGREERDTLVLILALELSPWIVIVAARTRSRESVALSVGSP